MYFENVQYAKIEDAKINAIIQAHAMAYGSGNLKQGDFNKFLTELDPRNKKEVDTIKEMKQKGLPIEEI